MTAPMPAWIFWDVLVVMILLVVMSDT